MPAPRRSPTSTPPQPKAAAARRTGDAPPAPGPLAAPVRLPTRVARREAFAMFAAGATVGEVMRAVGRSERAVRYWRSEARASLGGGAMAPA